MRDLSQIELTGLSINLNNYYMFKKLFIALGTSRFQIYVLFCALSELYLMSPTRDRKSLCVPQWSRQHGTVWTRKYLYLLVQVPDPASRVQVVWVPYVRGSRKYNDLTIKSISTVSHVL